MGRLSIVLSLLMTQVPLGAWGRDGHIVIARLAAAHLTPHAREQVIQFLANDPEAQAYLRGNAPDLAGAMAAVSNWADEVRGQTGTSAWHFIDLAASQNKADIAEICAAEDCITTRVEQLTAVLAAGQVFRFGNESFSSAAQLKFIIHLMGDLHQPLHCATNADAGGNCVRTSGYSSSELHAAWDTQLIQRLETGRLTTTGLAAKLDAEFAGSFALLTQLTEVEDMAMESHAIAFTSVYPPLRQSGLTIQPVWHAVSTNCGEAPLFEQPPAAVLDFGTFDLKALYPEPPNAPSVQEQIIERQLATAGYRLAALLNRLFP